MSKLLNDIKSSLSITIDDKEVNKNIELKINTVKAYLKNAGADIKDEEDAELTNDIIGCIAIGVNDLLNNKAGDTKFSPAFNILAMQVCRK